MSNDAVVANEVSKKLGKKFTIYHHNLCYEQFNVRPLKGAHDPSACDIRYCQYDDVHKDYCYHPEWVDFLVEKLSIEGTYNMITKKSTNGTSGGKTIAA